ncbi:hypothetical protein JCM8547_005641 [Rhodosporidiobolus lusitaniae]
MPGSSTYMHKFTEEGGDELLCEALQSVPVVEGVKDQSLSWEDAYGRPLSVGIISLLLIINSGRSPRFRVVKYTNALCSTMSAINQRQHVSAHEFTMEEVAQRLRNLDRKLKDRGVQMPPPSHSYSHYPSVHPSVPYGSYSGYKEYPEETAQSAPATLQPPYNGPPGPTNPYRSLGHERIPSSLAGVARPLRHAAIYGMGSMRL